MKRVSGSVGRRRERRSDLLRTQIQVTWSQTGLGPVPVKTGPRPVQTGASKDWSQTGARLDLGLSEHFEPDTENFRKSSERREVTISVS